MGFKDLHNTPGKHPLNPLRHNEFRFPDPYNSYTAGLKSTLSLFETVFSRQGYRHQITISGKPAVDTQPETMVRRTGRQGIGHFFTNTLNKEKNDSIF